MPFRGFLVFRPIVVGPGGGVGHRVGLYWFAVAIESRIDGIVMQDLSHHCQGVGIQVLLGDQGDGLVSVAAPGECAGTRYDRSSESEYKSRETESVHVNAS